MYTTISVKPQFKSNVSSPLNKTAVSWESDGRFGSSRMDLRRSISFKEYSVYHLKKVERIMNRVNSMSLLIR